MTLQILTAVESLATILNKAHKGAFVLMGVLVMSDKIPSFREGLVTQRTIMSLGIGANAFVHTLMMAFQVRSRGKCLITIGTWKHLSSCVCLDVSFETGRVPENLCTSGAGVNFRSFGHRERSGVRVRVPVHEAVMYVDQLCYR